MTDDVISAIQFFTIAARAALEAEAANQLEGIYGWLPDGTFANPKGYPAIAHIDEARETRRRLEQFADDEQAAGLAAKDARRKLIRETAFTWLNRLAAFRLMEERKLLKQTIVRLAQSNGFIFWLTDEKTPQGQQAYAFHQQGALPLNAMGEGPSDQAYRRFLLWQCGELARDLSVLFDPDTPASRLCPRPPALKQLVADMNAEAMSDAWKAGNEETIGWVYAAFNAEEKRVTFDAFSKGKKVTTEQIAPATQVFTPRWVVRYLVENSLGRVWAEMHPDSQLKDTLGYLVPAERAQKRPLKLAREISFLDPATGSMHFGLVAFDIFVEIYREELERAGQPGWPTKASVDAVEDIAASIIANNIHGMDLDLRAVQLSTLTLLLRARTINPKCAFTDANLACANVEEITGGRLEEFIKQAKFSHPIYERILRALAVQLKDSNNLGSLLRLEKELERLIAEERRKVEAGQQFELSFRGLSADDFKTQDGIKQFFDILSEQVLRHLDDFVRASRAVGSDPAHFANEASKGIRFLRLVERRYDIVATNPPYLDSRDYSAIHKTYLEDQFPSSKRNLFAAFIQRCLEFANPQGLVAMITGQSFMFISSYEKLRADLLDGVVVETLAQFDYHLFKERVDTAAFVLRRESDKRGREEQVGVYFRLVKEPDADSKRRAFETALAALRKGQTHSLRFHYTQKDFYSIPGKPWVYWMTRGLRGLFKQWPLLRATAPAIHGTATYDNARFLRYWWEVGLARCVKNARTWSDLVDAKAAYVPYMKGGPSIAWFGNQELVCKVHNSARELREFLNSKRDSIRGEEQSFRCGITWTLISPNGFAARLSPRGFIFDVNGVTCFPPEDLIPNILGLLNSRTAQFLLSAINPTIAFQVGDIERLPIPTEPSPKIADIVDKCVELVRQDSRENETTYHFIEPLRALAEQVARRAKLKTHANEIDAEVSRLYGLLPEDLSAIDREITGCNLSTDYGIVVAEYEMVDLRIGYLQDLCGVRPISDNIAEADYLVNAAACDIRKD